MELSESFIRFKCLLTNPDEEWLSLGLANFSNLISETFSEPPKMEVNILPKIDFPLPEIPTMKNKAVR